MTEGLVNNQGRALPLTGGTILAIISSERSGHNSELTSPGASPSPLLPFPSAATSSCSDLHISIPGEFSFFTLRVRDLPHRACADCFHSASTFPFCLPPPIHEQSYTPAPSCIPSPRGSACKLQLPLPLPLPFSVSGGRLLDLHGLGLHGLMAFSRASSFAFSDQKWVDLWRPQSLRRPLRRLELLDQGQLEVLLRGRVHLALAHCVGLITLSDLF